MTFKQNSAALMTKRIVNQEIIQFISSMIGTVFGLLSAFGGSMAIIEKHLINLREKLGLRNRKRRVFEYFLNFKFNTNKDIDTAVQKTPC